MIHSYPERTLLTKVIEQALNDAATGSIDAYKFLTTSRIDPFLILLDIEPDAFRERVEAAIERRRVLT